MKVIWSRNIECAHELGEARKGRLLALLEALPDGNRLCHGDFHFGNVMSGLDGYVVIDYMNICRGHVMGDIARTVYLIELTPVPPFADNGDVLLLLKKMAAALHLKEMGVDRDSLTGWLTVVAAARLGELKPGDHAEREGILRYLGRVMAFF